MRWTKLFLVGYCAYLVVPSQDNHFSIDLVGHLLNELSN